MLREKNIIILEKSTKAEKNNKIEVLYNFNLSSIKLKFMIWISRHQQQPPHRKKAGTVQQQKHQTNELFWIFKLIGM